tara:strand:+ start:318 stop:875 length:558 start_codon:yes stop_codon:yes gene_type:complete
MSFKSTALNSIDALKTISNESQTQEKITNIAEEIRKKSHQGKFSLIFGNGGSAADAQHFAAELVCTYKDRQRKPYKAIALTTDTSIVTAWANDFQYESIFRRQLEAFGDSAGFAIGLSTSGKSKNVIDALMYCKENNISTCMITGNNELEFEDYDFLIKVPSKDTGTIQTVTQVIYHSVCDVLEV